MAKRKQPARVWVKQDDRLFTLEVYIIGGPMTEKFAKKNKVVCRTIQIRGDQTLEDLHYAIFDAFDREDQHMGALTFWGKRKESGSLPEGQFKEDYPMNEELLEQMVQRWGGS